MRSSKIALLLSAFVFPGLGQVYKHEVKKGVFLILASSLLLGAVVLGFFIISSYHYAEILAQTASPEAVAETQLRQMLVRVMTHPFILFTFGLLLATWLYSIFDAGRQGRPSQED
ncbi:hypothetical protein [Desulfobacca acetoxidans]|uniref:DUF5683 domain-containing protein n=1 Tax=Desulfobacca acetoxidans (strain ATCC 700848 / DSM 11109 / ASRB2) TaxID=880072 RepID=F2NDT4_DESAR|nr:hypothetical protein [Desulfobacca acetoxidans]AEB10431.1 hypothetical protein Desac_2614 [Desulfobacca acetoxidans DSM 11109]HAY20858.1 hypothetical protein [Desulfobacterales bacterium]